MQQKDTVRLVKKIEIVDFVTKEEFPLSLWADDWSDNFIDIDAVKVHST